MKRPEIRVATLSLLLVVLNVPALSAHAAEGGYTNYFPGFYGNYAMAVAPDPGIYFSQYLYGYGANGGRKRFVQNGEIRTDAQLYVAMWAGVALKVFDAKIAGGRLGIGGWLPVSFQHVSFTLDLGSQSRSVSDHLTGVGDMGILPVYFWWDLAKGFHIAAFEQITAPTGTYNTDDSVNNSLNYWSFDTNFAATYLNEKHGFEISADVGYIINTKNIVTDYRTGQELHIDYNLNKYLSAFGVGIEGFFYQQITGDSGSGAKLGSFRGRAAGIGPSAMWSKAFNRDKGLKSLLLTAAWQYEFTAKNRLKGNYVLINLMLEFSNRRAPP